MPSKLILYSVHIHGGNIGLIAATSEDDARQRAYSRHGSDNVSYVELATPDDIAWVRGMGGYVPEVVKANA